MIKRKLVLILLVAVLAVAFSPARVGAVGDEFSRWAIPYCNNLVLGEDALGDVYDEDSALAAIDYAVAAFVNVACECDDALGLVTFFIEDAIRRGAVLDVPVDGILYSDLLQTAVDMAQSIRTRALEVLADEGISLPRELSNNIAFVSDEPGILEIEFPDDVSGIEFDYVAVETEFAVVTIYQEIISGSAFHIERGLPVATGGYAYIAVPTISNEPVVVRSWLYYVINYWAIAAFAFILLIWGILASMGKRLRLWVVPVLAVILIAANMWTLGLLQERPDGTVYDSYAPAPVYFYSVIVTMDADTDVILSIPLNGAGHEGLVLHNENGEPLPDGRHNPLTDTIDTRISTGGTHSLRLIDISG